MPLRYDRWIAACLTLLTLAACSTTETVRPAAPAATPTATQNTSALEALYWARQDSARTAFTQADVDFMTGMIGHHAQALVMSRLVPTHGARPSVQRLAARIINSQNDEIAAMQKWLRDRGQTVPEIHIDGLNLMVHGGGAHDHMHMPGMLTEAQLHELDDARGETFDRLFLKYMIQHHSGAITMVDALFGADGAALDEASFKLASDINVDQRTEIARMQKMLDSLPAPAEAP